jgi:hypothetical protein
MQLVARFERVSRSASEIVTERSTRYEPTTMTAIAARLEMT